MNHIWSAVSNFNLAAWEKSPFTLFRLNLTLGFFWGWFWLQIALETRGFQVRTCTSPPVYNSAVVFLLHWTFSNCFLNSKKLILKTNLILVFTVLLQNCWIKARFFWYFSVKIKLNFSLGLDFSAILAQTSFECKVLANVIKKMGRFYFKLCHFKSIFPKLMTHLRRTHFERSTKLSHFRTYKKFYLNLMCSKLYLWFCDYICAQ